MVKEKVRYSDAERFDAEFKKRQSEINNEISIWSQSESFRLKVREIAHNAINDHDQLVNLSRHLFENGIFLDNFKDLTKKETESNTQKIWIKRSSTVFWICFGVFITALGEFFIKKFC